MNTVEKGDAFEAKARKIIQKLIDDEHFGYRQEYMHVYEKRGYYSNERKENIIFDIVIEVWLPGATKYSLIYFIECKNYKKRVPVEKIERFRDQVKQVAGLNVKPIFITNSPLQKSAFNIADAAGIMLIQGESTEDYKIILHKSNKKLQEQTLPFMVGTHDGSLLNSEVRTIEKIIDRRVLNTLIEKESEDFVSYGIDRLSKKEIENIVMTELNLINPSILKEARLLSLNSLKEYLRDELAIKLQRLNTDVHLLGYCDFEKNTIGVSNSVTGSNREFFVLAHEFGHMMLHSKLSIGQNIYDRLEDSKHNFRVGKHVLNNPRHWIEWQANYFASSLIMPTGVFLSRLFWTQRHLGLSQGKVYIDDQKQNILNFLKLRDKLAYILDVSKTTVVYRLNSLDLILNNSRTKSLSDIVSENRDELFI